jgi:hypothetical protein
VSVEEDRASDKRIAIAFGTLLVVEVLLGYLADAGTIGLIAWLVLGVLAILVTGAIFARVQTRAEGPRRSPPSSTSRP